ARSSGQPQGTQPAAGLGPGLVQLALGDAVDDDAGAGAQLQLAPVQPGAADQDVEVEVAAAVEVAEGAGVGAAALAFQLGDDFHAAHLGRAGDGAAGKDRPDHLPRRHALAQFAADVGDDVVHVFVGLHHHQLVHAHAARPADPAQVVALQVDEHHMLGPLLGMADQLADALGFVITGDTRAGAGDRAGIGTAAAYRYQPFRRTAEQG